MAFSTGCVATCNFLVLYALMHRHLQRLEGRRMATLLVKVAFASAALAVVCWSSQRWLLQDWARMAFAARTGWLLLTIVTGIGVFLWCGALLRIEELHELGQALRRRAHRAPTQG